MRSSKTGATQHYQQFTERYANALAFDCQRRNLKCIKTQNKILEEKKCTNIQYLPLSTIHFITCAVYTVFPVSKVLNEHGPESVNGIGSTVKILLKNHKNLMIPLGLLPSNAFIRRGGNLFILFK